MAAIKHQILRPREMLVLIAILSVALLVRLVRIDTIPANFMLDEADNAQDAYRILAGRGTGFFGFDWSHAPLFSMYIFAAGIRAFGDSVAAIRSMPVLLSTASLVPFFLIARRQVGLFSAACASGLLATSLWYLHFSRTAWINMTAPLFALWTVYFLTRALEHGRVRDYLLVGAFIALGAYGYPAGRSIPIAVLAALPLAVTLHPERYKRTLVGFALAFALASVLFTPHLLVMAQSLQPSRMSSVSIFAQREYLGETNLPAIVLQQVGRNLAGFVLLDPNQMGRGLWAHYLPPARTLLDHGTGVFFWIGLIAGLLQWRTTFLWWLLFLVPVLTVQVFSLATPDAGRGLIVAPFMYLFVALGIESVHSLRARWAPWLVTGVVLGAVLLLAARNLWEYFDWIERSQALNERHPAVELTEFPAWSELLREDLANGGRGFGVAEWRARIDYDGCKSGTVKAAVCRHTDLLPASHPTVQNRAPEQPPSHEGSRAEDAEPPPQGDEPVQGRIVRASTGASVAERDQARRRDLVSLARALEQLRAERHGYPTTDGEVQTVCSYSDDAGCALHTVVDPIPADPRDVGQASGYWYRSDGTSYALYAVLEGEASAEERCSERPEHIALKGDLICLSHP